MNNKRKRFLFRYDSSLEKLKKKNEDYNMFPEINIEYTSNTEIDKEEYKRMVPELHKKLDELENKDIVEIAKIVKEYFENLPEYRLEIQVTDNDYTEQVRYEKGIMIYCSFCKMEWEDKVFVSQYYGKINIEYKKEADYIDNIDKVTDIYSEINAFLQKIIDLRKLNKKEELVTTKTIK